MRKVLKDPIKLTLILEREDAEFFRNLMPEDEKFFSGFMARLLHKIRLIWEEEDTDQ